MSIWIKTDKENVAPDGYKIRDNEYERENKE